MDTDETRTRSIQGWADTIAVGALVLSGLLVSVCAPILRGRNETLRGELDRANEVIGYQAEQLAELVPPQTLDDEGQAAAPDLMTADYGDKAKLYPQAFANGGQAAELAPDMP